MKNKGWPKYFYVDNEMYVKLHVIDGKLVGTNDLGGFYDISRLPVSPFKEITKNQFERGATMRRKDLLNLSVSTDDPSGMTQNTAHRLELGNLRQAGPNYYTGVKVTPL